MALVSKILEQTLPAGSTAVTFTDADIPNSLIRVFSSNPDIIPVSRTLINATLTVTYEAQAAALDVAVEIVKQGLDIVDNVLSEDTDKALSAKQGYLLKAAIDDNSDNISTLSDDLDTLTDRVDNLDIPDNITDLDDVTVTNIQSGQVLAWDGTKFVNVDQSDGSSVIYSTDEQLIGKWINNKNLYQKTVEIPNLPNATWAFYSYTVNNGDLIFIYDGFVTGPNGDTYPLQLNNDTQNGEWCIRYQKSQNRFALWSGVDRRDFNAHVTIRYTKTTD